MNRYAFMSHLSRLYIADSFIIIDEIEYFNYER